MGGVLTQALNWRWALLINVPAGVLAIVLARHFVPESRDPSADRRLDIAGLCRAAVALFALTFAFTRGPDYGWTSTAVVGPLLVAAVSVVGFVRMEQRAQTPLFDPALFRGNFAAANLVTFAIGVAWFGAF